MMAKATFKLVGCSDPTPQLTIFRPSDQPTPSTGEVPTRQVAFGRDRLMP